MTDVIGRGVIEVSADSSKLNATINEARRSISTLGDATKNATAKSVASIDRYVKQLQIQQAVTGKTTRETELYKLALRGASDEQLRAANNALKLTEAYERGVVIGDRIKATMLAIGAAAAAGSIAAYVAFESLVKKAGEFQDLAEKTGDTAENMASLALAAGTAGASMESVAAFSIRLTKGLTDVDDESKKAGAAIAALGLDLEQFKSLKPADQMEALAKALNSFADGTEKTAVMEALAKGAAQLLPFLKELGAEGGRQILLTQQQIELADAYADRQAKLRTEIGLSAQGIATKLIPTMDDLTSTIAALARDQDVAAVASATLQAALDGAIVVLQTIALLASDVGFTFQTVGRAIGGMAAQLVALVHLDMSGFSAINDAILEDTKRARETLDKFQARVLAIGKPVASGGGPVNEGLLGITEPAKRKLQFDGADKKQKDTASQEAKAQLAYDLEQIKKQSEAITNTFSNAEKIMQARRAAGLIDEREYYAEKLNFLRINTSEQESALQKEIERLRREQLVGKDKIDNDRKIVDAEAKLAKVRADASANVQILSIQETAARNKVKASYESARQAAQDYFDSIRQQQQREVDAVGQGIKKRKFDAGINQIEDRYAGQRRDLENQKAQLELEGKFTDEAREQYQKRLEIIDEFQQKSIESYTSYYQRLDEKQGDWALGATEALRNYYDESRDIAKQTEDLFTNAFKGMEDALVEFVTTGKLDFKSLADSIIADIARIIIKQQLASMFNMGTSTGAGSTGGGLFASIIGAFASGGGGSIASAAGGYDIPAGVNPVTQLHEREMVLPAKQADVIRDMAAGGGGAAGMQIVSAPVINIDSRTDRAAILADVNRAVEQGNVRLVDQLSRGRRI